MMGVSTKCALTDSGYYMTAHLSRWQECSSVTEIKQPKSSRLLVYSQRKKMKQEHLLSFELANSESVQHKTLESDACLQRVNDLIYQPGKY